MAVTAYVDLWTLWNDSTMQTRAKMACVSAANMVLVSGLPAGATANQRKNWARYALIAPETEGKRALWGIIANATIQTNGPTATDAMLYSAVSAYVPTLVANYSTGLLG